MKPTLRLIYMGTPDFAVGPLRALLEAGWPVLAVVTAPDKPAGRGLQLRPSPVKAFALEAGLPVLQPAKLRDPEFLDALRALRADLQVVVAFRMLPEVVWAMPRLGSINLHASLLPAYRGAAPIHWALINGERETGLSTFFLQHEIDTGDLIFQQRMPIGPDETFGELHDRMAVQGADLVLRTVQAIAEGNAPSQAQAPAGQLPAAPKLQREHGQLHWDGRAAELHNRVRGLSPWPCAWTEHEGQLLKVYRSGLDQPQAGAQNDAQPGAWLIQGERLWVRCADAWLELLEIQASGKKRMKTADFLRGWRS
jgi:methionyl-tRNA formyltransferase